MKGFYQNAVWPAHDCKPSAEGCEVCGAIICSSASFVTEEGKSSAYHIEAVPVPERYRRDTEIFNALFKPIPLSESEKLPDPDYGL